MVRKPPHQLSAALVFRSTVESAFVDTPDGGFWLGEAAEAGGPVSRFGPAGRRLPTVPEKYRSASSAKQAVMKIKSRRFKVGSFLQSTVAVELTFYCDKTSISSIWLCRKEVMIF
jgi:hypothetical protein